MPTSRPFLMFSGQAQSAMDLYCSTFPDSRVVSASRYDERGPGPAGTIQVAVFTICGREFMCSDSFVQHAFTFTPSSSIFVDCDDRAMFDAAFSKLAQGGSVLMPPGNYGFSAWFGWLVDRFGVSWQLNVAA